MVGAHVVDREGNPTSPGSGLAYERGSVAVPFGGCVEPSNVKAGGGACRIRFQCGGCGFYRPDPSYLPAIEQQINDLRADREPAEAMGAAEFVTRNLTEQINAYRDVVAKMRKKLAGLSADERAKIEEASTTIMRKVRAGSGHVRLPITPRPAQGPGPVSPRRGQPELLRQARRQDSLTKRQRVLTTLERRMIRETNQSTEHS